MKHWSGALFSLGIFLCSELQNYQTLESSAVSSLGTTKQGVSDEWAVI